jgi:hypothetical protein
LNFCLHLSILGSSPLKIQVFCSFQIHQHITMIISIAKGSLSNLLMCLVALSGFSQVGTLTPTILQQFFTNGHQKNRCCSFSSDWKKHIVHNRMNPGAYFSFVASLLYLVCSSVKAKRRPYAFVGTRKTKAI